MQRTSTHLLACLAALVVLAPAAGCDGSGADDEGAGERAGRSFRCPRGVGPGSATGRVVTLFHETHTHGHLAGLPADRPHDVTFARYMGLRNALRPCLVRPDNSLFLGNGDDLSPALAGVRTEGEHTVAAFNAAGIDANTFGFSELNTLEESAAPTERSLARLRELVAASEFPWVSANVREGSRPERVFAADQGARLWILRDVGGVRVGITGLLGARGPPAVPPGLEQSIRVIDPVDAMREVLPPMRAAGAQLIVLLSHMDHVLTLRVVRSVDGIDVALGTHQGEAAPRAEVVNRAIVAVAGPIEIEALGQLDLTIRGGRIQAHVFRRHVPTGRGPVDRRVEAALARFAGTRSAE
jgi:2',3'-cyclic-nucleotide 2'-phosphodiesterase (5'-nucleotidase family)